MLSVIGEESPGGMSMHHGGGGLPAAMVSQAGPVPLDFGMDRMDPTGMEHHMQSTASDAAAAPQGGLHQSAEMGHASGFLSGVGTPSPPQQDLSSLGHSDAIDADHVHGSLTCHVPGAPVPYDDLDHMDMGMGLPMEGMGGGFGSIQELSPSQLKEVPAGLSEQGMAEVDISNLFSFDAALTGL